MRQRAFLGFLHRSMCVIIETTSFIFDFTKNNSACGIIGINASFRYYSLVRLHGSFVIGESDKWL